MLTPFPIADAGAILKFDHVIGLIALGFIVPLVIFAWASSIAKKERSKNAGWIPVALTKIPKTEDQSLNQHHRQRREAA